MGMLLAWCTNLQLLSSDFVAAHERVVLRLRMQEITGSELLVQGGGNLTAGMFSAQGNAFLQQYYPDYLTDYQEVFGELYGVADNWQNYARLAKVLTARYMSTRQTQTTGLTVKLARWLKWLRR